MVLLILMLFCKCLHIYCIRVGSEAESKKEQENLARTKLKVRFFNRPTKNNPKLSNQKKKKEKQMRIKNLVSYISQYCIMLQFKLPNENEV